MNSLLQYIDFEISSRSWVGDQTKSLLFFSLMVLYHFGYQNFKDIFAIIISEPPPTDMQIDIANR